MPHVSKLRYPYRARDQKLSLRFSNLYLHVIKKIVKADNRFRTESVKEELAEICSTQIRAIPRHYMDHKDATLEERRTYHHKFCDKSFCPFMQLNVNDQASYKPTNSKGKPKNGELFVPGLNGKAAMDRVITFFDEVLADVSLLKTSTRFLTTNANESLHARLYINCSKIHHYKYNHLNFASQYTMSVNNHGYVTSSLLNNSGYKMNSYAHDRLKHKDLARVRNASRTTKKRRDKLQMLQEGEQLYGPDIDSGINVPQANSSDINDNIGAEAPIIMHSDEAHEHNDPLPGTNDLDTRDKEPWHNPHTATRPSYYEEAESFTS